MEKRATKTSLMQLKMHLDGCGSKGGFHGHKLKINHDRLGCQGEDI